MNLDTCCLKLALDITVRFLANSNLILEIVTIIEFIWRLWARLRIVVA